MRESCRRPAAERQTKMMDDGLEPLGPSPVTSQDAVLEVFAENSTTTKDSIAPRTSRTLLIVGATSILKQVRRGSNTNPQ
jgi:hypothetical protein